MTLPQPRAELRRFAQYQAGQVPGEVRLQANEWPEPNPASGYLTSRDLEGVLLNRYPGGAAALRAALAREWGVAPDQISVSNGSNEVLFQTIFLFAGPGRTLLHFPPTYPMYARLGGLVGSRVVEEPAGLPYVVERDRVLRAIAAQRPDVVCFCSPNNPTGNLVDREVILAAAEAAPGSLVLVDEAYADFAHVTLVPDIADHPNVAVAKTFSKVRAAAGLRVGALVAHAELVETFEAVRLPYTVGVLTQAAALKILADRASVTRRVAQCAREREKVIAGLRRHGELEVFPSTTNFVLFRHRTRAGKDLHAAIAASGVLARDVSMWAGAERCIRVSIGTPQENERFLAAVGTALEVAAVPAS